MSAAILFGSMALMIGFGIPIAIVLGVSSALTLLFSGAPLGVIPSMMQATVQKFSLLTIPLSVSYTHLSTILGFIIIFLLCWPRWWLRSLFQCVLPEESAFQFSQFKLKDTGIEGMDRQDMPGQIVQGTADLDGRKY